jgi:outer membrane lipopolysaccharide assembly protein LptE/RlpB
MIRPRFSILCPLASILSFLLLAGCGYHQSGRYDEAPQPGYKWQSLYRQDIQTVAVPTFQTKDFHTGVEFRLSKAVVQQLEANTPYKVVDRDRADTILEGEVINVRTTPLSTGSFTNIPQEQLVTVTVNFLWKDLRSGRILVQRKGFDQSVPYYPTLGEGEVVGIQQSMEKLALAIVQELQAEW